MAGWPADKDVDSWPADEDVDGWPADKDVDGWPEMIFYPYVYDSAYDSGP